MRPRYTSVLLTLAAATAIGLAWRTDRRSRPLSPTWAPPSADRTEVGERDEVARRIPSRAPVVVERLARSEPTNGVVATKAIPEAVRVHGVVRRHGRPLEDFDLEVHAPDDVPLARDWDFTDEHGEFELRVPPGRYLLTSGDHGWWGGHLVVPIQVREHRFDIDLP